MVSRSFARLLALAAIATCPARTAALLHALPVDGSIAGIRLIAPGDPSFNAAVTRLVPSQRLQAAAPYLPSSVIVDNQSGQPLVSLTVYFAVTDTAGRVTSFVQTIAQEDLSKPALNAGSEIIVALRSSEMEAALAGHPIVHPWSTDDVASVSASVDLVIYADGSAHGPNAGNVFGRTSSRLRAIMDVCTGVERAGGSGMTGYLSGLTATPVTPPGPVDPDEYAYDSYLKASALLRMSKAGFAAGAANHCGQVLQSVPSILAALHR